MTALSWKCYTFDLVSQTSIIYKPGREQYGEEAFITFIQFNENVYNELNLNIEK